MSPLILIALLHAAPAQTFPQLCELEPFTQPANYMSLRGALRLMYRQNSGRWMTRQEIDRAVEAQLVLCASSPPLPTGQ